MCFSSLPCSLPFYRLIPTSKWFHRKFLPPVGWSISHREDKECWHPVDQGSILHSIGGKTIAPKQRLWYNHLRLLEATPMAKKIHPHISWTSLVTEPIVGQWQQLVHKATDFHSYAHSDEWYSIIVKISGSSLFRDFLHVGFRTCSWVKNSCQSRISLCQ